MEGSFSGLYSVGKLHKHREGTHNHCSYSSFSAESLTEVLEMSGRVLPILLLSLCLTVGSVQSQGSPQDAFIIQYMERRLAQMEVGDRCAVLYCTV